MSAAETNQTPALFDRASDRSGGGERWTPLICTHVQQQHGGQEGLTLAVADLLVVDRVGLQGRHRQQQQQQVFTGSRKTKPTA